MNKIILSIAALCICALYFISCGTADPKKYFDIAVLNTNVLSGFADNGILRQLESPSVKLDPKSGQTLPMKSTEVLNSKIEFVETNLDKLKDLKLTDETKDMVETSISLFEYVLKAYKTDYTQLAGMYDNNSPEAQINILSDSIHEKYYPRYTELYKKLIEIGKVYAEKNSIKVNWGNL